MNYRMMSCLVLVVTIGFLHSIQAEHKNTTDLHPHFIKKTLPEEGTKSEKCKKSKTAYVLMDSCGSHCSCLKSKTLFNCEEVKCKEGEDPPYTPVEDYEVVRELHHGIMPKTCEPGTTVSDGCNECSCGEDGTPADCTSKSCSEIVYRKKE